MTDASSNGTIVAQEVAPSLGQRLGESVAFRWLEFDTLVRDMRRKVKAGGVHDVRVTIRRLIALTDLVRETVPVSSSSDLRRRLKKYLKRLGALRDAQVQVEVVEGLERQFPAAEPFHRQLRRRVRRLRKTVQKQMRQVHLRRLEQLKDRMLREVEPHWKAVLADRHRSQTLEAIDRAFSAVIEARTRLDMTDLDTVHQMRVPFKKFRYMVEAVQPFLVGVGTAQLKSMHAFQRMMGDVHDLDVLSADLARFRQKAAHRGRLTQVQDELAHRLLMASDSFMAASDEIYSFWDQAWFPDKKKP